MEIKIYDTLITDVDGIVTIIYDESCVATCNEIKNIESEYELIEWSNIFPQKPTDRIKDGFEKLKFRKNFLRENKDKPILLLTPYNNSYALPYSAMYNSIEVIHFKKENNTLTITFRKSNTNMDKVISINIPVWKINKLLE